LGLKEGQQMKKMFSLIALATISMPAFAAGQNPFYGAIGTGAYELDSYGFDERAATASLLGGYNFSDSIAVEASYTRLFSASGDVEGIRVKVDGDAWDLSTKLSIPVGERFMPYGRLGWSYLDLKATGSSDGVSLSANEYDDAFTWAVGTGYKLNSRLSLNGEYSQVLINDGDFDRLSMNLNYRFGSQ
jgi:outer membrane autotransporter protein